MWILVDMCVTWIFIKERCCILEINITKFNFALKKQLNRQKKQFCGGNSQLHVQCTTSSIANFLFQKLNVHICFYLSAEIKRADENATAFVSCPALTEHENPSISLYKEDTKLHSTNLSDVKRNQSWQRFQVYIHNTSVSYTIRRTEASDTGLYNCQIETQIRTSILLIEGKTRSNSVYDLIRECPLV